MGVNIDDTNFKKEVLGSTMPVLVDFWADWCMPCLMLAPVLEDISKEYAGKIKICKLNVDEAPETASRYEVMSIPTIMIFKNGEIVSKTVGAMPKEAMEDFIKPHLAGEVVS